MITKTRVKQAVGAFIKVLRYGKDDIQTASNVLPSGIDSKPVKNRLAIHVKTNANGEGCIIGYVDNSDKTNEGETRIYATDSEGVEVFSIKLNNDGECEFGGTADNMVRYSKLKAEYDKTKLVVDIISTTLKTWITIPMDGGLSLKTTYLAAIGANVTGDISACKIDEVKCS